MKRRASRCVFEKYSRGRSQKKANDLARVTAHCSHAALAAQTPARSNAPQASAKKPRGNGYSYDFIIVAMGQCFKLLMLTGGIIFRIGEIDREDIEESCMHDMDLGVCTASADVRIDPSGVHLGRWKFEGALQAIMNPLLCRLKSLQDLPADKESNLRRTQFDVA